MGDETASLVHPVLTYGLALRERLEAGEAPPLDSEQATLMGLLLSEREARRWPDYGGAPAQERDRTSGHAEGAGAERFLGARYALVCWLDELFVLSSPWRERWNEHKLEVALYASNDRAWRFWDQARLAAARGGPALAPFFLCVMLGFRGELGLEPDRLREWVATARAQLARGPGKEWSAPPEREPAARVPPLSGRRRLQRLVLVAGGVLLALVPVLAFVLAYRLSSQG